MIQSPLGQFRAVIRQIAETARTHAATLNQNEAFTRMALVDKALAALGWDLSDSGMVVVEYHAGQVGRLDYALFGPSTPGASARPVAIVEAKKLGGNLQDNVHQIIAYAIGMNIDNVFLTDGLTWSHYKTPFTGPDTHTLCDFRADDPSEAAAYLMGALDAALQWPDKPETNMADQMRALESRLHALEERLLTPPRVEPAPPQPAPEATSDERVLPPGVPPVPHPALAPPEKQDANAGVPLDQFQYFQGTRPASVVFTDGAVPVGTWTRLLAICAERALRLTPTPLVLPLQVQNEARPSRTWHLLNSEARHVKGPMLTPKRIESKQGTVYLETNFDPASCLRNAAYLLCQAGQPMPRIVVRKE